ncbi:hypothetical protein [Mesorhizobium japonicum]|uniref:hypothetical protein n=1 Tax=Mesorhizobium japonicum TaxID=2066070 RepID=UPI0005CA6758|nr:hypothetical protein [Mesorhizobium japonicum]
MQNNISQISQEIARSTSFDAYSFWRIQRDIDDQVFALARNRTPIPIELARLKDVVAKARVLRRTNLRSRDTDASSLLPEITVQTFQGFDPFDFVARYRALGGLRLAVDVGFAIEVRQWDKDTPEADSFWIRGWTALDQKRQSAVARALLVRGRF